jgi:PAS domain S-box-containing protein
MNTVRRDLGIKLLTIYLLFVGPILLGALVFDRWAANRLEADVKAADLALARAIAQETDATTSSALRAVKQLSTYSEVIYADSLGMESVFRILLDGRPDANLIYRLDENGRMVYHYPIGSTSTVGRDFSDRDYFLQARQSFEPFMSSGRISPTTGQPVATAVMPLWGPNRRFLGVVAINLKLQTLSHTLTNIATEYEPQETFDVYIIDTIGQVVAHPWPPMLLRKIGEQLPQIANAVLNGETNTLIAPDPNGRETLYSYVPIPSAGWGVIANRSASTAFATQRRTHNAVLFLTIFLLTLGILFWLALSRQVLRPLENLTVFSQTIGRPIDIPTEQRQLMARLARRADQIGHLIRSLLRMEQSIDARLKELSTLLETSAEVVSSLDSQTVLNRILEQVERLLNVEKSAIVALEENRNIFRVQASRGLSKKFAEDISVQVSDKQSIALVAIHSHQPVQVSDIEQDDIFADTRPRARAEGYRSVLAVPLLTQHADPAALLVFRPEPYTFSQSEIDLLSNFANQAAMAIENATLYARSDMRLREQTRRLEALIQSMQDGLLLEDLNGIVLYANRRIGQIVELDTAEIIGYPADHLIRRLIGRVAETDPEKSLKVQEAVQAALVGSGPRRVEFTFQTEHQLRDYHLMVFDVTDSNGARLGSGQIISDITQSKEVDRMKSSLVSTVSHELRTPLAAIKGYATTLLAEDVEWDRATQREFLSIISGETDHLSQLVTDLLDMSRLEAGSLKVNREECSLKELLDRAAQRAHPPPNGRLVVDLPVSLPTIFVDPQRIEAVLRNLIENAAKYSGEDSLIRVSAEVNASNMIVRVEDEGPGIPSEYSQRIFESFFRLDNGLTRATQGVGVGLSICQGFIRVHGGDIWLEQREKGACIAFSLPLTAPEDGGAAA